MKFAAILVVFLTTYFTENIVSGKILCLNEDGPLKISLDCGTERVIFLKYTKLVQVNNASADFCDQLSVPPTTPKDCIEYPDEITERLRWICNSGHKCDTHIHHTIPEECGLRDGGPVYFSGRYDCIKQESSQMVYMTGQTSTSVKEMIHIQTSGYPKASQNLEKYSCDITPITKGTGQIGVVDFSSDTTASECAYIMKIGFRQYCSSMGSPVFSLDMDMDPMREIPRITIERNDGTDLPLRAWIIIQATNETNISCFASERTPPSTQQSKTWLDLDMDIGLFAGLSAAVGVLLIIVVALTIALICRRKREASPANGKQTMVMRPPQDPYEGLDYSNMAYEN